jgi:methionyl-tRNA synthetase
VIGKGINRFHSVYWIGMLLSAGLATPKAVSVHGYITANGKKMGKSLGNVIDTFELVAKYGLEPVRYYLLKHIPTHSDGDFSYEQFEETYTADLANGLGNLCSRVAKMCEQSEFDNRFAKAEQQIKSFFPKFASQIEDHLELGEALTWAMSHVADEDKYLAEQKPWTKTGQEQAQILDHAVGNILVVAFHLQPFMPDTAQKIFNHFSQEKISSLKPLFPRLPQK